MTAIGSPGSVARPSSGVDGTGVGATFRSGVSASGSVGATFRSGVSASGTVGPTFRSGVSHKRSMQVEGNGHDGHDQPGILAGARSVTPRRLAETLSLREAPGSLALS